MPRTPSSLQVLKRRRLEQLAAQGGAPAAKPRVAVTDLTARLVQEPGSRRVSLLITLHTDAGVTGIGEAPAGPSPAAAADLAGQFKADLVGADALAAEAVRQKLGRRPAGKQPALLAAVNMALLDILGKIARTSTHEALGGPTRTKARVLACFPDTQAERFKEAVQQAFQAGFRAFAVPLPAVDLAVRPPAFYRQAVEFVEMLRKAVGDNADFILDCGGRLGPAEAVGLARAFERFHLLFLDEPCAPATPAVLRKLTEETVTPLGVGHQATKLESFQELLRHQVVDVLRPDLGRVGMTDVRKAAALAETHYVAVAPVQRGGPTTTAAALQVAATIPNFFIQEVPVPADERDRKMRQELVGAALESPRDGFLPLPTGHGLGVTLNEDAVKKYLFKA